MRTVRSLLVECEVSDRVESCKEFVRRNARYLIELRVVRRSLGENQGILIELRAVRSLLEEFRGIRLS